MVREAVLSMIAAGSLAACGGGPDVDPAAARIEGLRAALAERSEAGGAWSARWRLCWSPVTGARAYAVSVVTSEGAGRSPRRVDGPCWSLTVASGVPRRHQLARQVALLAPSLSVNVAAVLPGGRTGPPSPDVPVGAAYP